MTPDQAKAFSNNIDSGFGNCPSHPDYELVYDLYPMPHRPVFEQNEYRRKREMDQIEAIKGIGI